MNRLWLLVITALALSLCSCRKTFPDGPRYSIWTQEFRLTGEWHLQTIDDQPAVDSLVWSFHRDKSFEQVSPSGTITGTWSGLELFNDYTVELDNGDWLDLTILRLKQHQMNLEDGNGHEMHFTK